MPCIVDITEGEMANHWEALLCQACKHLTREQIDSLKNPGSGILDGLDWYTQHLMCDYTHSKSTKAEKKAAYAELDRLGYYIEDNGRYKQLVEDTQ